MSPKKADTTETLSIDGREVRITHPEKPYFTKQTKSRSSISFVITCRLRPARSPGFAIDRSC